ncbi:MAG: HEAT repeat domain-containing protein [Myxococcales bacterium]|nr:MAG: HEAT repeat domain-containing protein [Myxococcales bacterium]
MKFAGPTSSGANWSAETTLEITIESRDELEKNNDKYLRAGHCVVRTSADAKPGDRKQLLFRLPGGSSFEVSGVVEKVKEQPGKDFAMSLFKLENFGSEQQRKIDAALAPAASLDIDSLDFDVPLTKDFEPPTDDQAATKLFSRPSATATQISPPARVPGRSAEEEALMQAILSDDAPMDEEVIEAELPEELKGVSGDLIMPKKEGAEEDPWLEQKKYIIAFVLSFTKSVQRSGYYDASHPEAVKAKKGLYALFRKIIGRHRELNFIRKAIGDDRDVLIDGALEDMVSLKEIMPQGMAQLYIPRFMEYLERRCLISLSIKRIINEDKFNRFIDLMSQYSPEYREDSRKEGERFTRTLIEHGILEVSAIFDEDIISSGRKLPWQAELTLSRLKKDLKTVPLLKSATIEELRQIKIRIFRDTIKPLRSPTFLIAVLLNADLVMEGIDENEMLKDIDVEQFMIWGADAEFLAGASLMIIREWEGVRELQKRAPLEAQRTVAEKQEKVLLRILKHITDRFLTEKNEAVDNTLEEFYNRKLIPFKALPLKIQERITNKKLSEAFLTNADEILKRFDSPLNDKEFSEFVNRFQRVVPLLSEKKEYMLVGRIIAAVRKHLDDRDVRRKSLTKRFFDYIGTTNVLPGLKNAFEADDKEMRAMAAGVFVSFGRLSVPILLETLKKHEDKWVRKLAIRSLQEIGAAGVQAMVNELYKEDNPWYFLRNVVSLLGEMGDRKIVGKLTLLLYHQNPAVREETIQALFRIAPQTSETHIMKALDDPDPKVRLRAISCLGQMGSQNEKVMRFYMDVLEGKIEVEDESLAVQVYRAVSNLKLSDENVRRSIEEVMVKKLEDSYGAGLLAFFKTKATKSVSDGVKMAICQALGEIGNGKRVRRMLTRVASEKDPILSQRAKDALKQLQTRQAV